MTNYCAFSKDHKCIKWEDYQQMLLEVEEADETCHGNWIEIQRKERYIEALQLILEENNLHYPSEWMFD